MIPNNILHYVNKCPLISSAAISTMKADCSGKRHYRAINSDGISYVIMDASNVPGVADLFLKITNILASHGLSSPKIFDYDQDLQILLTEDFGHDSYKTVLEIRPEMESQLYTLATEVLIRVAKITPLESLPVYMKSELNQALINSFIKRYAVDFIRIDVLDDATNELCIIFDKLYSKLSNQTLALRDYHIDNLMLLDDRDDYKKVGLLDIQDASISFASYDLVSLLEDARRDVNPDTVVMCKKYFLTRNSNINSQEFEYSYSVLGLQRSMRILGLFHFLSKQDDKKEYGAFIPRVSRYIKNILKQNDYQDLLRWSDKYKIPLYVE